EDVLPDVFSKVIFAKHLLLEGKARNVAEASRTAGLSRSAFYKYRDRVFEYEKGLFGSVITIQASLCDRPGVLACVCASINDSGANILTVNQNVPVSDIAFVSFSISVSDGGFSLETLINNIQSVDGVLSVDQILRG
ncbi:MAG: ACT domain-containing protein, partial [Acutalibacteraceae bacterium]